MNGLPQDAQQGNPQLSTERWGRGGRMTPTLTLELGPSLKGQDKRSLSLSISPVQKPSKSHLVHRTQAPGCLLLVWPCPPQCSPRIQLGSWLQKAHFSQPVLAQSPCSLTRPSRVPFLPPARFSEHFLFSRASSRASEKAVFSSCGLTLTFLATGGGSFPRVLYSN